MTDKEFDMAYCKMLVDLALKKAAQYELEGNKERAEYFLALAEKAEETYKRKIARDQHFKKKA